MVAANTRGQVAADTLVEISIEGQPPHVARWDAFVCDNADDDSLDWSAISTVIATGGTWRDGGGAAPIWSIRRAP